MGLFSIEDKVENLDAGEGCLDTSLATILRLVDQLSEQDREQVTEYLLAKRSANATPLSKDQPDPAELKRRFAEWLEDLADIEAEIIASKRSWLELEGIAAGAGREENAQVWVTKMRDEWDDRESQWQTSV